MHEGKQLHAFNTFYMYPVPNRDFDFQFYPRTLELVQKKIGRENGEHLIFIASKFQADPAHICGNAVIYNGSDITEKSAKTLAEAIAGGEFNPYNRMLENKAWEDKASAILKKERFTHNNAGKILRELEKEGLMHTSAVAHALLPYWLKK